MLKNIGIIGEGKMGTNLFYYLLDKPYALTWVCSHNADVDKIRKSFQKKTKRSLESGLIDETRYHQWLEETKISDDPASLSNADLIIEAIPEDISLKKELFHLLGRITPEGCILTSNSSSILPSLLVPDERRAETTAGLHFFYPVALKNIVEIIRTPRTSQETAGSIAEFLRTAGRNFLLQDETSAFMLNRIFLSMQNEAFLIVSEGKASFAQVDELVRTNLLPTGVFDLFDSVGLDVMLSSILNYTRNASDASCYSRLISFLSSRVSEGKLGVKSGAGIFDHSGSSGIDGDRDQVKMDDPSIRMVLDRLRDAFIHSAAHFISLSGLPPEKIKNALNEYVGDESALVSGLF